MNADGTRTPQIYGGKAVYVSTGDYSSDYIGGSAALWQINRVQGMDWTVDFPLQQPTYLNAATESYLQHQPGGTVTLKYYHSNSRNEQYLGLAQPLAPSGTLQSNVEAEKTIYLSVENSSVDAIGASGAGQSKTVIGLAQCVLTQYSLNAAVGSTVDAAATFQYLTSFVYSGASGNRVPAVNYQDGSQVTGVFTLPTASSQYTQPEPSGYLSTGATDYTSALSYSELFMLFPVGTPFGLVFTGYQSVFLQSFNCAIAFDRQPMLPMGYQYPAARPIQWPVRVDLSTEVLMSTYQADQLSRFNCLSTGQSVFIVVKQPCTNATLFGLYFDNLQVANQSFVTSIGRNDVVSIQWRGVISNPFQLFYDPTVNYLVQQSNTGAWGTNW